MAASLAGPTAGRSQFSSFSDRRSAVLEGNWQSCVEADGVYSERVYDNTLPGIGAFELHLGPYHEFALFRGVQDDHRDHNLPDNLLRPHKVELQGSRASQTWQVAGLRFDVALAGGAGGQCESWFISLKKINPTQPSD